MAMTNGRSPTSIPSRSSHVQREPVTVDELSVAIVEAVASMKDVDPVDVEFRLYDYLDPEALDDLYRHATGEGGSAWTLEFTVDGFEMTVRSDGDITIA